MSIADKSVLIVDDMKMIRVKLRQICSQMGLKNIYEAADGVEALETLKTVTVDLILSDWNMPKMTGIELVEELRKIPNLADVPIIFITSEDQRENILKSLMSGVTDYVVKPFTDGVVKQKIFSSLKVASSKGASSR
jgi:two-component system chemotaxis response regulator CheY